MRNGRLRRCKKSTFAHNNMRHKWRIFLRPFVIKIQHSSTAMLFPLLLLTIWNSVMVITHRYSVTTHGVIFPHTHTLSRACPSSIYNFLTITNNNISSNIIEGRVPGIAVPAFGWCVIFNKKTFKYVQKDRIPLPHHNLQSSPHHHSHVTAANRIHYFFTLQFYIWNDKQPPNPPTNDDPSYVAYNSFTVDGNNKVHCDHCASYDKNVLAWICFQILTSSP